MKGFDTAARLTLAQATALHELGYDFAIRYLVPSTYSKALTKGEALDLSRAGLRIGLCWETTASRARDGAYAGMQDGQTARNLAQDMGVPSGAVIYFAVDYGAPAADYDRIFAYMVAAASAVRPYRLGVYGSYYIVEEMHRRGIGDAYWQCVGWSGGKVSEHLNIYQREWNVKTDVVTVDNNYCSDVGKAGFFRLEEEPMIYEFTPMEMGIYVNSKKKSITAIQKELNCDVLCNLNLFNGDWTGACYTRADGRIVGSDGFNYFGFGFDRTDRTLMRGWSDKDKHRNFFGCWDILVSGNPTDGAIPAWTNGLRRRTVIGTLSDGKVFVYANTSAETIAALRNNLTKLGAVEAVVLDGGGSTQLICPTGTVVSSDKTPRAVHTLFYANTTEKKPVCPYNEPASNIRSGSIGSGAKWVQWQLNRFGYGLTVDGIIGTKSVNAIKDFQRKHNLSVDGICGVKTREELKK